VVEPIDVGFERDQLLRAVRDHAGHKGEPADALRPARIASALGGALMLRFAEA
jgi:hypothetical protein